MSGEIYLSRRRWDVKPSQVTTLILIVRRTDKIGTGVLAAKAVPIARYISRAQAWWRYFLQWCAIQIWTDYNFIWWVCAQVRIFPNRRRKPGLERTTAVRRLWWSTGETPSRKPNHERRTDQRWLRGRSWSCDGRCWEKFVPRIQTWPSLATSALQSLLRLRQGEVETCLFLEDVY